MMRGGVMAFERWMYADPARVLERKQEIQARSRQGRQVRAREALEALFEGESMTQDESQQVEDLLQIWFDYEDSYRPALGAPRVSPSCRGHDPGNVHDTGDDRDAKLNKITAEAVGSCVDELHYLQRAAIGVHFRNKRAGVSVRRNPRIEEQHAAYQEAKREVWPARHRTGWARSRRDGL